MSLPAIFMVAFALGIDAFSLSIGIGLNGIKLKRIYIVSFVVAFFHIIMPLIGLYIGQTLGSFLGPLAGKFGALVLIYLGAHTLWESLHKDDSSCQVDMNLINSLGGLILLAISVSLDALTVGFGLGTLKVNLLLTVIIMGIVAGLMTFTGLLFGKKLNCSFGEKAEIFGSIILLIVGLKLLFF